MVHSNACLRLVGPHAFAEEAFLIAPQAPCAHCQHMKQPCPPSSDAHLLPHIGSVVLKPFAVRNRRTVKIARKQGGLAFYPRELTFPCCHRFKRAACMLRKPTRTNVCLPVSSTRRAVVVSYSRRAERTPAPMARLISLKHSHPQRVRTHTCQVIHMMPAHMT